MDRVDEPVRPNETMPSAGRWLQDLSIQDVTGRLDDKPEDDHALTCCRQALLPGSVHYRDLRDGSMTQFYERALTAA
jgi:hypothetical protein